MNSEELKQEVKSMCNHYRLEGGKYKPTKQEVESMCNHYRLEGGKYKPTIDIERRCRLCNKVFTEESIRDYLVFIKLINNL